MCLVVHLIGRLPSIDPATPVQSLRQRERIPRKSAVAATTHPSVDSATQKRNNRHVHTAVFSPSASPCEYGTVLDDIDAGTGLLRMGAEVAVTKRAVFSPKRGEGSGVIVIVARTEVPTNERENSRILLLQA